MSFHNLFQVGQAVGEIPWFRPKYGEIITFVFVGKESKDEYVCV